MKTIHQKMIGWIFSSLLIVLLFQCQSREETQLVTSMENLMEEKGKDAILTMKDLTSFPWEKLYIFPPYTSQSSIEVDLKFSWSEPYLHRWNQSIENNDSITLLIFVQDNRVMAEIYFPRGVLDFSELYRADGYPVSEAVFSVQEDASGWRYAHWDTE